MSKFRENIITNCEKKFLVKSLSEWTRLNGRAFDEYRELQIELGKDFGCCYVSLGKTKVLAQVSCEIQEPKSSRPSEGNLFINIDLSPIAAPHFEPGKQSDFYVELNRLLEKCLKDSKAVDLESMCIRMNEKVWALKVDINVLNHEGNILDCASIAALTALAHFRRPDVTCDGEEFIIHKYESRDPIPTVIHHYPVCVTYAIFQGGEYILMDPDLLEEGVADAFLTIGVNSYGELCVLHLGGQAELPTDRILENSKKAAARAKTVVEKIKEIIEQDNAARLERQNIGFHQTAGKKKTFNEEDLNNFIDQWRVAKSKKKDKNQNKEKLEDLRVPGKVETVGSNAASFVPGDTNKGTSEMWKGCSEEDDDDVEVVEVPKKQVQTIDLIGSDSEEEKVVVLNADKKTNKKKRKL